MEWIGGGRVRERDKQVTTQRRLSVCQLMGPTCQRALRWKRIAREKDGSLFPPLCSTLEPDCKRSPIKFVTPIHGTALPPTHPRLPTSPPSACLSARRLGLTAPRAPVLSRSTAVAARSSVTSAQSRMALPSLAVRCGRHFVLLRAPPPEGGGWRVAGFI